jgi:hypothetical protein
VESRPVNRTSTLAFFAGDRYFGVMTAYVPGQEAENYRFTSALPSAIVRLIGAEIGPLTEVAVDAPHATPHAPKDAYQHRP